MGMIEEADGVVQQLFGEDLEHIANNIPMPVQAVRHTTCPDKETWVNTTMEELNSLEQKYMPTNYTQRVS